MENLKIQNFKTLDLFENFSDDQTHLLLNNGSFVTVHSGETLFHMGTNAEYIYLIIFHLEV